jgi:ABC-type dipeptide/oligopeptide/nickel transport system permease component
MIDYIAMGTSIFGLTVPNFWLALILILFFSLGLCWFPSMGYIDPTQDCFGSLKPFVIRPWCWRCLPVPLRRV